MDHLSNLLSLPPTLWIERVIQQEDHLTLVLHSQTQTSSCPECGTASTSLHGSYWRFPRDLPLSTCTLMLQIRVLRFRCVNEACQRRTFAETMAPYVLRYSRRTQRVTELLTHFGLEVGGQAGARISQLCHLQTSRWTVLRLVRRCSLSAMPPVEVLGVDEWAFRRGDRYGTILVDLERRRVLDLLPEAQSKTFSTWLKQHPSVRIITRDRAGTYSEGAQQGAPTALHVADRWHLLHNLRQALILAFDLYTTIIKQIVAKIEPLPLAVPVNLPSVQSSRRHPPPPTPIEQARSVRQRYWEDILTQVHDLTSQGMSQAAIARQLGVSLSLVKKYKRLKILAKKQSPKFKPLLIEPYLNDLRRCMQQGSTNTITLLAELRTLGFQGSRSTVYNALVRLRQDLHIPSPLLIPRPLRSEIGRVTPRMLALWLVTPHRSALQQELVQTARELHPSIDLISGLAQDFLMLIRQRKPHHLLPWIEAAQRSGVASLKQFAQGLLRDIDAVEAACRSPWSNGQVEGQVNRIKLIKRQMYGRANFDLLRLRVLYGSISTQIAQEPTLAPSPVY